MKNKQVVGIDISKSTFDAAYIDINGEIHHKRFKNNKEGFRELLQWTPEKSLFVMEATGIYFFPLATFLYENKQKVSVLNPRIIKSFCEMKLQRAKTDKRDAIKIAEYGNIYKESLTLWEPKDKVLIEMYQTYSSIEQLKKYHRSMKQQYETYSFSGNMNAKLKKSLLEVLAVLEKKIKLLEAHLLELCKKYYNENYELLRSIPGIGIKAAILLIILTNNFKKFSNHKQLIAYSGTSPRIILSGTSVRGRGSICKSGNTRLRRVLYMCSLSAKRHNASCRALYERLKARGKPEKVIRVAIINKLLKQAFGVIKKREPYDPNYVSYPLCYLN